MPPSWIRPNPRSTTPLCFGPSTPVCSWWIVWSLHSLAKASCANSAPFVHPQVVDAATNVGQEFRRRRGYVGRALVPGVEPSHAHRVVLELDQVQSPAGKQDFPGAGKVNQTALQRMRYRRESHRRHRRTPTLRLLAPTASDQGTRELDALLLLSLIHI